MKSPYFVAPDATVLQLFELVMTHYPHFDKEIYNKKTIYKALFPTESFDAAKFRKLCSALTLLIEELLVFEYVKKERFRYYQQKALYYYYNGNFSEFHKTANIALKSWQVQKNSYGDFEQLALYQHIHYYPYAEKQDFKNTFLSEANSLMDQVFVLGKLRYYAENLSGRNIFSQHFKPTFTKEVLEMAYLLAPENPIIRLYVYLIALYETNSEESHFNKTRTLYVELNEQLTPLESSILLTLLINFCNYQYFYKKIAYLQYQFQLYSFGLEKQLFTLYGYIGHNTFMNIVITASVLKDFEFIEKFLGQYIPMLQLPYRSKCKQLGYAYVLFYQESYFQANQKAILLGEKEIFFSLRANFLALRCNFEFFLKEPSQNQKEVFLSFGQGFKVFLNKQIGTLSASKIEAYLNHLAILRTMALALKVDYIPKNKGTNILNTIHQTPKLIGWKYLLDKANSLIR